MTVGFNPSTLFYADMKGVAVSFTQVPVEPVSKGIPGSRAHSLLHTTTRDLVNSSLELFFKLKPHHFQVIYIL